MSNSTLVQPMSRVSLGIDVSKAKLDFTLAGQLEGSKVFLGSGQCPNTVKGYEQIIENCSKLLKTQDLSFVFSTVEATGIYHQGVRQYLYDAGLKVVEVLPNKSKAFTKVLNVKTKNDRVDAKMLAIYGLTMTDERLWKPFASCYEDLKSLTRHRETITVASTRLKNKHHATKTSYKPNEFVLEAELAEIAHYKKSIKAIDQELRRIVRENPTVKKSYDLLQTVPGIGPTTALVLLAETNGFKDFTSRRQLVSYAGLDVVERTSGNKVLSENHISKRGNAHIRRILYNGAGHFAQKDKAAGKLYNRLKVDGDAKGRVPVMRKVLTVAYGVFKTGKAFDPALRHIGGKQVDIETGEVLEPGCQKAESVVTPEKTSVENVAPQKPTNVQVENAVRDMKSENSVNSTPQKPKRGRAINANGKSAEGHSSDTPKPIKQAEVSSKSLSVKEEG
jgi:transposase